MQTLKPHCFVFFVAAVSVVAVAATGRRTAADDRSPNVLIAISDDQSWPHASAYGSKMVKTPNFDRVAREGVLFTNAFSPSPGCSPSRASFLTGLHTWQLEHAGTHASYFDQRFATFPDQLTRGGYYVGYTGKGWGPGNWRKLGRQTNPAGPVFQPASQDDKRMGRYAGAFANFLRQRPADKPFCFWFGSSDPHRGYAKASGLQKGKRLADAEVPAFLPDTPEIRGDMLDYAFEVERFDDDLGKILKLLEQTGELDNTLVIVTSDNGIPIPRAKANCYEWGIHMPLAIRWGQARAGRTVDDLVGFVDLTATIYDATGVDRPAGVKLVGRGIANLLTSSKSGIVDPRRDAVYSARERHSSSRYNSLSYPQRCIRTQDYLYIRNFKPERWPAGPAQKLQSAKYNADGSLATSKLGPPYGGFHDIDACPTLDFLIANRADPKIKPFLDLSVAKRPAEELYDIRTDSGCLRNLADDQDHERVKRQLNERLMGELRRTGDPRASGNGDVWETYPRVSRLRWFPTPDWAKQNPDSAPTQEWLDERRPQ